MGTKVTLTPLTIEDNSSYENNLNNHLDTVADEFDNVMYRDGSLDMQGNLNMNSKRLLNVGAPVATTDAARLRDVTDLINQLLVNSEASLQFQRKQITAIAGQTAFTFDNDVMSGYVAVYQNGVRLDSGDFTHLNDTVTLTAPAALNDVIILEGFVQAAVLPLAANIETSDGESVQEKLDALIADLAARNSNYATRTLLKAVTGSGSAYLTESGRQGLFNWDSSDLSTQVTSDTEEGVYIAPDSDPTGASGAWVRYIPGAKIIDALWFGIRNDTIADASKTANFLQFCIDNDYVAFIPIKVHLVPDTITLTDGESLSILGIDPQRSVLVSTVTSAEFLFASTGGVKIRIAHIRFGDTGAAHTPLLDIASLTDNTQLPELYIDDFIGDVSGSPTADAIVLRGYRYTLNMHRFTLIGSDNPTIGTQPHTSQTLLSIGDNGRELADLTPSYLSNGLFLNGALQYDHGGNTSVADPNTGGDVTPHSPVMATNLLFYGAKMGAIRNYHSLYDTWSNIVVKNATSHPGTDGNNINAVVWLDAMAPRPAGIGDPSTGNNFQNLVIADITGNAIFVEELMGELSGVHIFNVVKGEPFSFWFNFTTNLKTDPGAPGSVELTYEGGNGIIITGSSQDTNITARIENVEGEGVLITRPPGVTMTTIGTVTLRDCVIVECGSNAIKCESAARHLNVFGGMIADSTGTDIYVTRNAADTFSMDTLKVKDVIFNQYGGSSTSTTNIKTSYAMRVLGYDNSWHATTSFVDLTSPTGEIRGGRIVGGNRPFTVSGTGGSTFFISGVEGYRTRYRARLATTDGVITIPYATHGLGHSTTNLAPYYAHVTVHADGDYNPIVTFSGTTATVNVYEAGALSADEVDCTVVLEAEINSPN